MRGVTVFSERAREYDRWFSENRRLFQAEVHALRALLPPTGPELEVGVGTGRFASALGIPFGVDPARGALEIAARRGLAVCQCFGEGLPFSAGQFACVALITVDPFVEDPVRLLKEILRVLKPRGRLLVGMIDGNSPLGRTYEQYKDADPFYREARFHSVEEMVGFLQQAGFQLLEARQTLIGAPGPAASTGQVQAGFDDQGLVVREGYGQGAFVALSAQKGL